jgi:hypothetical protein
VLAVPCDQATALMRALSTLQTTVTSDAGGGRSPLHVGPLFPDTEEAATAAVKALAAGVTEGDLEALALAIPGASVAPVHSGDVVDMAAGFLFGIYTTQVRPARRRPLLFMNNFAVIKNLPLPFPPHLLGRRKVSESRSWTRT